MRPPEVPPEGPTLFLTMPPPGGSSGGFNGRGKKAEKREKRQERELFSCFSWSAEGVFPKDSMTLGPSRWLAVVA